MSNTSLYDVHTHMHDNAFADSINERMLNIQSKNISLITIGTDLNESRNARDLAHKYEYVYYTVGLHPHDNLEEEFVESDYLEFMSDDKCVAIGECGLDYYYLKSDREKGRIVNIDSEVDRQQRSFIQQIGLAEKYNKPLMIHGRPSEIHETDNPSGTDAYEDMLDILEKHYKNNTIKENNKANGNVHFFVGDKNIAERFMDIGFTFSFGGVLTLTDDYNDLVKFIPLEYIHAETDSPYVTPKDNEGRRVSKINSSENVEYIVNKIAEIKNLDQEIVKIKLKENFKRDYLV